MFQCLRQLLQPDVLQIDLQCDGILARYFSYSRFQIHRSQFIPLLHMFVEKSWFQGTVYHGLYLHASKPLDQDQIHPLTNNDISL